MLPIVRSVAGALVRASARIPRELVRPATGDRAAALSRHGQRVLNGLLEGAAATNGYGPLDWHFDPARGLYVARADWHPEARMPDDATLERWGRDVRDWAPLTAACSTGTALAVALFTDPRELAREKVGASLVDALRGNAKKGLAPDPFLAPRARYVAEGSRAWWRTWTWREFAAKGLPDFIVPVGEEQPVMGLAVYSGHVGTWWDCERLRLVDPFTGDRCRGVWVLFWDGGFWDEAWHPVRRSWVQATQTTRAKRWRERRRYRYQRVRWESIETRATREPRVTSRTFALVGLQAPDQVPDSLRLAIEPRAAA